MQCINSVTCNSLPSSFLQTPQSSPTLNVVNKSVTDIPTLDTSFMPDCHLVLYMYNEQVHTHIHVLPVYNTA